MAWLGGILSGYLLSLGKWFLTQLFRWALDFFNAWLARRAQDKKDQQNADEFKETLGKDKPRDERSRKGEDLLNSD